MKLKFLSALVFLFCVLTFSTFTVKANDTDDNNSADNFACANSVNVMDCIEKTKPATVAPTPTQITSVDSQQLGLAGPFSAGARYDTDLGWIPEISYIQMFYDNGIRLQLGYGANEQRANITLGHTFNTQQQIKITYEYLSQNLPFNFTSGQVNEWVNQNAFGAAYRYLFFHQFLHSIDLSGYYMRGNSKNLSDVIFYQNNDAYLNSRHIAGGTEETVTSTVTLTPLRQLFIKLGGGYSHLVYDTEYEDNQDTTALAYNAGLDLLLFDRTKVSAGITNSAAETDSTLKISQILPAHIEAAITGQYSQGQAGQPNSTSVTLALAYPVTTYSIASEDALGSLKAWIQTPVVHAPRVLAIKDEAVKKYSITSTNPAAQSVQTGQMIQEIHTQDIFNFDPSMFDEVVYSLSLANNSNNLSSPQTQLNVDLKPDNNSAYNSIVYSTAPLPNSSTPTGGKAVYQVLINATGYKNGLAQPIQAQAVLELDVNFDPNNEPQWDKNKTTGTILFDQSRAPSAINLNSYLSTSQNTDEPQFYFKDPAQYPNWQLQESSGAWYLTRATGANGAYIANDVNTTVPVIIYVKYKDDPANIPPSDSNSQNLSITISPDSAINLQWNSSTACQLVEMFAIQPINAANSQAITLFNSNDPANQCVQYIKNNAPVLINGDAIGSITAQTSFQGGVTISAVNNNPTLTVNPAIPADMGRNWDVTVTVPSAAAGTKNVTEPNGGNIVIPVDTTLQVNGVAGQNAGVVTDSNGFKYAAIFVSNASGTYTLADYQVENPDSVYTSNPYVCPGKFTDPGFDPSNPSSNCVTYTSQGKIITNDSGDATILWMYHANGVATTIDWVKLIRQ